MSPLQAPPADGRGASQQAALPVQQLVLIQSRNIQAKYVISSLEPMQRGDSGSGLLCYLEGCC